MAKDRKYIAKVKLILNRGRLKIEPGTVFYITDADVDDGVHEQNLLRMGGIVPFKSQKQADEIKDWWERFGKKRRESVKTDNMRARRQLDG